MKQLLQQRPDRGYPAEYLLSRIRGRRSRLISDWRPLIYEAAVQEYLSSSRYQGFIRERTVQGVWRNLIREYGWVYLQMNEQVRALFAPYFLYTELRTLFITLRQLKEQHSESPGGLLDQSLLSDEIKDSLAAAPDLLAAVKAAETIFCRLSDQFKGMTNAFEAGGLRALEQKITHTYLSVVMETRLHPLMKQFFARLIDARNIMSSYKCMRLEQSEEPAFLAGGFLSQDRLRKVIAREQLFGICSLARQFFGARIDTPDPTKIELALYKSMTRFLKQEGREPSGIGPMLDYLWRCSIEAMNLSMLFTGKDLERDLVAAELVR